MKRILATSAIVALVAAPGFSQADMDAGADLDASGTVSTDATGADTGAEAQAEVGAEGSAGSGAAPTGEATIDTQGMGEAAAEAAAGITADALIGADVHDVDGVRVSTVSDLVLNADGQVSHILIDVGGFLGIGARTVAVAMPEIEIETAAEGDVSLYLSMTEEQIAELPEHEG